MSTTAVEHADRQTRIADLAIHGWVPVRRRGSILEFGMFYPAGAVGFIVVYPGAAADKPKVNRINLMNFPNDSTFEECAWDDLFNDTVDIIEARLREV